MLQYDVAPPYLSQQVRNYLNQEFPDRWIRRGSHLSWPPKSPDYKPFNFCYWDYLKTLMYAGDPVQNDAELERHIHNAV